MAEIENPTTENSVPFYPVHVSNEAKVVLGISVVSDCDRFDRYLFTGRLGRTS